MNNFSVVELSEDGKRVRCNICAALRVQTSNWIQKESLVYYLKSDVHACSVTAKHNRESIRAAGEQSMQEEMAVKERMDFVMLSSTIKPVTATAHVPGPSVEEKEMWDNYLLSNEIFDAGIDHTVAKLRRGSALSPRPLILISGVVQISSLKTQTAVGYFWTNWSKMIY